MKAREKANIIIILQFRQGSEKPLRLHRPHKGDIIGACDNRKGRISMQTITLDMFQTSALAMVMLIIGRALTHRIGFLNRYCIPAPVTGGILFSLVHLLLHACSVAEFAFDSTVQTFFMTVFFTGVGFSAGAALLKRGGRSVLVFLGLTALTIVLQDACGVGLAKLFGWDPRLGLCTASVSMVGGHGTAAVYGKVFEDAGVYGAGVVAAAAATYGLISGSLMGGPLAERLIRKNGLISTEKREVTTEETEERLHALNTNKYITSMALLLIAAGIGTLLSKALGSITLFGSRLNFSGYIGGMLAAALIRNAADFRGKELPFSELGLWSSGSLTLFLSIALMSLKLWQLADLALPMLFMLLMQTVLMYLIARFVVYRLMGADYEAAVITAGFCGFGMGATPNAMANMQSVTAKRGPAPRAFLVVPLVGSLFADFINSIVLTLFTL